MRIGFNRKFSRSDQFYPANHLKFNSEQELQKKGSYQINEGESQTMNYDFSLNFSRQVKELHYLFGFLSTVWMKRLTKRIFTRQRDFPVTG